jgi:nucleoside-diphosphate-sugar epimerase
MNILVTGASGFIGQHLCQRLISENHNVTALVRTHNTQHTELVERPPSFKTIFVADISNLTSTHLQSIDTVIHLAAVTHDPKAPESLYRKVNVEGTRHLANCCVEAGVKRLIFVSSIKAVRERTRTPARINIAPAPEDAYGRSKLEAERLLVDYPKLETIIVRIPIVYGKGAKGNFKSLINLVESGVPLPVLAIQNKRSYIGVENLCDFLTVCVEKDVMDGHTFHVADGPPVSLAGLIRSIYAALEQNRRSFWIPKVAAIAIGNLFLGRSRASKLFGDLELDTTQTTRRTGWYPPYSMQQGLDKMLRDANPGVEN